MIKTIAIVVVVPDAGVRVLAANAEYAQPFFNMIRSEP